MLFKRPGELFVKITTCSMGECWAQADHMTLIT